MRGVEVGSRKIATGMKAVHQGVGIQLVERQALIVTGYLTVEAVVAEERAEKTYFLAMVGRN